MNKRVRRMTYITMLIAISVLLHYIESLIPLPISILGFRLGFANIVGLITYLLFGFKVMVGVNLSRVIMASLMRGVFLGPAFAMSLGGVMLCTIMVGIFGKTKKISVVALSVISSIFHCVGQILMAIVFMKTTLILTYLPILLVLSIPTGIFTGIIASKVIDRLEKNFKIKEL